MVPFFAYNFERLTEAARVLGQNTGFSPLPRDERAVINTLLAAITIQSSGFFLGRNIGSYENLVNYVIDGIISRNPCFANAARETMALVPQGIV